MQSNKQTDDSAQDLSVRKQISRFVKDFLDGKFRDIEKFIEEVEKDNSGQFVAPTSNNERSGEPGKTHL